jgi:glucose/arabinose dehydrogenase
MKPSLLAATSILTALSALTGCTSNAPTAETPSTKPQPKSTITHSEGVPKGVETGTGLTVPPGFKVEMIAEGFNMPRRLAFAPGGTAAGYDLFVAESKADQLTVLRMKGGKVAQKSTFVTRLNQPYGIAFLHNSIYVANTDNVLRFPYKKGDLSTTAEPQKITTLTEGGYNQHWTRNLLVSGNGKKLFVTVGSSCNTCEEDDEQRAAISEMNPDGSDKRLFARGLRNPVGLALRPGTTELWTAVNERDNLGDDVPPDYLTRVKDGAFYGWPYAYTDIEGQIRADPNFGPSNPKMVETTTAPDVPVQAHSAALGVAFYPSQGGNFPRDYAGDAFLTYHGSWNRSAKTGYKVVRVNFEGGKAKSVTDFVTGTIKDGDVWGRLVDVQVAPDGSIFFSDDGGGKIWRVSYAGK